MRMTRMGMVRKLLLGNPLKDIVIVTHLLGRLIKEQFLWGDEPEEEGDIMMIMKTCDCKNRSWAEVFHTHSVPIFAGIINPTAMQ